MLYLHTLTFKSFLDDKFFPPPFITHKLLFSPGKLNIHPAGSWAFPFNTFLSEYNHQKILPPLKEKKF